MPSSPSSWWRARARPKLHHVLASVDFAGEPSAGFKGGLVHLRPLPSRRRCQRHDTQRSSCLSSSGIASGTTARAGGLCSLLTRASLWAVPLPACCSGIAVALPGLTLRLELGGGRATGLSPGANRGDVE